MRIIRLLVALSLALPAVGGAQRRADVVLDSAALAHGGGQSLAAFLAGRVPGLAVHGVDGTPALALRVTTAGAAGLGAAGEPLLFVDGVLLRDDPHWSLESAQAPASFGWGLPVDEIAEIRVVLGAASGADVAFGASRGAVFVTTRRPSADRGRVRASAEMLSTLPTFDPRANEGTFSTDALGSVTTDCTLFRQRTGNCEPTGRTRWAPLLGDGPFTPAAGVRLGADATGATGAWRYRASVREERIGGALFDTGLHRTDAALAVSTEPTTGLRLGLDARYAHLGGRQGTWQSASPQFIGVYAGPVRTNVTLTQFSDVVTQQRQQGFVSSSDRFTLGGSAQWTVKGVDIEARASADELVRRGDRRASAFVGGAVIETRLRAAMPSRAASVGLRRAFALAPSLQLETGAGAHWMRTQFMDSREVPGTSLQRWNPALELSSLHLTSHLQVRDRLRIGGGLRAEGVRGAARETPYRAADFALDLVRGTGGARRRARLRLSGAYGEASDHRSGLALSAAFLEPPAELERSIERRISLEARAGELLSVNLSRAVHTTVGGAFCCRSSPFPELPATPVRDVDWRTEASSLSIDWRGRAGDTAGWALGLSALHRRATVVRLPGAPVRIRAGGIWNIGVIAPGRDPISYSSSAYTFSDLNADGVIGPSEVSYSDEETLLGSPDPRWLLAGTGSLSLGFGIQIGATVESRLGHVVFDEMEALRCFRRICRAQHDERASLDDQAAAAALLGSGRLGGFVAPADNLRLRELYVQLPIGANRLRISAHQLLLFSRFKGGDPEAVGRAGAHATGIVGLTQPLFPSISARLEIGH